MRDKVASFLVGFTQMFLNDKYAEWYKSNGHFKFKKGDIVKLKRKNIAGYGIDPIGEIIDCVSKVTVYGLADYYIIRMDKYDYKYYEARNSAISFMEWMKGTNLQENNVRCVEKEKHFKWNIEHHFKKVK